MNRIFHTAFSALGLIWASSCASELPQEGPAGGRRDDGQQGVVLELDAGLISPVTRAGDADNLDIENNIVDLSLFLVPSGTVDVAYSYVSQPFSSVDNTTIYNRKQVILPLQPGALPLMDVHVIANCDNVALLQGVDTVSDIEALRARTATTATGLTTDRGLPMYGLLSGADLNTSTATSPAVVPLTRTCAKLRLTLRFTDPTWVGTNNSFTLENAPQWTRFVPGHIPATTESATINYPRMNFTRVSATQYTGIVYVYEAAVAPRLHLYTTVSSGAKEYVAKNQFPLPVRNSLYDMELQILKPPPGKTRGDGAEPELIITNVKTTPW